MNQEEREHIESLITQYKRNIRRLEIQKAQYGTDIPLHIENSIDALNQEIRLLQKKLKGRRIYLPKKSRKVHKPHLSTNYSISIVVTLLIILVATYATTSYGRNTSWYGNGLINSINNSPNTETSVINAEMPWTDCERVIIPEHINPDIDIIEANRFIEDAKKTMNISFWKPMVVSSYVIIKAPNTNTRRLFLGKRVNIRVEVNNIADHINIMPHSCHPTGHPEGNKVFDTVVLDLNSLSYIRRTNYPDSEIIHFPLDPGVAEIFKFEFLCQHPGTYSMYIEFWYQYEGKEGSISVKSADVYCPRSFTDWDFGKDGLIFMGKSTWKEGRYTGTP